MKRFLLGIDGGGSRSAAVLTDASGAPMAKSQGPALNPLTVGWDDFRCHFGELLDGLDRGKSTVADALCAGLAGVGNSEIRQKAVGVIREVSGVKDVFVVTDAEAALWGAFAGQAGLLLIAGTGSICLGMNSQGRTARSGGFGYLLGDEGGGWWIAAEAVRQALRSVDGRAPETALTDVLRQQFDLSDIRDIIPLLQNGDLKPADLAASVPEIFRLSRLDPIARDIVQRAGYFLAQLVRSTAEKLNLKNYPVALSGGLWESPGKELQQAFKDACDKQGVSFTIAPVKEPPEMGAVHYLRKITSPL